MLYWGVKFEQKNSYCKHKNTTVTSTFSTIKKNVAIEKSSQEMI